MLFNCYEFAKFLSQRKRKQFIFRVFAYRSRHDVSRNYFPIDLLGNLVRRSATDQNVSLFNLTTGNMNHLLTDAPVFVLAGSGDTSGFDFSNRREIMATSIIDTCNICSKMTRETGRCLSTVPLWDDKCV